jgi:SAM-dependent methyltransferase
MAVAEDSSRPQFGARFLTNPDDVFKHNAWDNVQWDAEREAEAKRKAEENSVTKVSAERQADYDLNSGAYWDHFYSQHDNQFFKDRHWLFTEFPELLDTCGRGPTYLEVGCGAGNTVFPLLMTNKDPHLFIYCCDFSKQAIDIVKSSHNYDTTRCHAFVWDITVDSGDIPLKEETVDVIILIFVLSAIHPDKMQTALAHLVKYLKPGGRVLFRDYGRYDMAQLRFKNGQCLSPNFYVRGDGTRVYFFTQEELWKLFTNTGLREEQNIVDRRLIVNRGKKLTMYRVWVQCKFVKERTDDSEEETRCMQGILKTTT